MNIVLIIFFSILILFLIVIILSFLSSWIDYRW